MFVDCLKVEVSLLVTCNIKGNPYILTVHVVQRFLSKYFSLCLFVCFVLGALLPLLSPTLQQKTN